MFLSSSKTPFLSKVRLGDLFEERRDSVIIIRKLEEIWPLEECLVMRTIYDSVNEDYPDLISLQTHKMSYETLSSFRKLSEAEKMVYLL